MSVDKKDDKEEEMFWLIDRLNHLMGIHGRRGFLDCEVNDLSDIVANLVRLRKEEKVEKKHGTDGSPVVYVRTEDGNCYHTTLLKAMDLVDLERIDIGDDLFNKTRIVCIPPYETWSPHSELKLHALNPKYTKDRKEMFWVHQTNLNDDYFFSLKSSSPYVECKRLTDDQYKFYYDRLIKEEGPFLTKDQVALLKKAQENKDSIPFDLQDPLRWLNHIKAVYTTDEFLKKFHPTYVGHKGQAKPGDVHLVERKEVYDPYDYDYFDHSDEEEEEDDKKEDKKEKEELQNYYGCLLETEEEEEEEKDEREKGPVVKKQHQKKSWPKRRK